MKLSMGYMTPEQEKHILRREDSKVIVDKLDAVIDPEMLATLRQTYREVKVSEDVTDYIMSIILATRESDRLSYGVSARGSLALYRASQITAAMEGRDYVIPEDVKNEAVPVLCHRIAVTNRSHLDGGNFIKELLETLPVPLEHV